tara:strand:+ start:817 stop:1113 length:297 start_codon:yes stop_codon:yes gene_type:complete
MNIEQKVQTFIDLNTCGDDYPTAIWLCFDDYKALRLGLLAFYKEVGKPPVTWDQEWIRKGYHGIGFSGANCYLKEDADPLPNTVEEIKTWKNNPPKEN